MAESTDTRPKTEEPTLEQRVSKLEEQVSVLTQSELREIAGLLRSIDARLERAEVGA